MTELETIKKAVESLRKGEGSVWLYRLNRGRDRECSGASSFMLPLNDEVKKRYFAKLAHSILGDEHGEEEGLAAQWEGVEEFPSSGEEVGGQLYWMRMNDPKISGAWTHLHKQSPEVEGDWLQSLDDENRESVNGVGISIKQGKKVIEFLSARPPVKKLKYAFWCIGQQLTELDKPVITLPLALDAIAMGERVYFLGGNFRKQLWSREEEKRQIQANVRHVVDRHALSNPEMFEKCVLRGWNRRRMSALDKGRFDALLDGGAGSQLGARFGVRVEHGKVLTESDADVTRFVKVVTNHGMMDPFKDEPREVSGSRQWE
jgi:hypothetical protein